MVGTMIFDSRCLLPLRNSGLTFQLSISNICPSGSHLRHEFRYGNEDSDPIPVSGFGETTCVPLHEFARSSDSITTSMCKSIQAEVADVCCFHDWYVTVNY